MTTLTLADIYSAWKMVRSHAWHTPLIASAALTTLTGNEVYLKLECWQKTGSFKVRGALNKLAALSPAEVSRTVVTASAGNHGLGIAYAAQALGLPPALIFVPETTPSSKLAGLRASHCQVRCEGTDYDTTHGLAVAYAREHGALYLSAYDDPSVIAGQGTVGLEIAEDMPNVEVLLVPVGGGGLIAGMAVVAKSINPGIQVLGVQPEASPAAYLSLRDGRPYETYAATTTICDGLAGGFGRVPFAIAGSLIDDILIVPEAAVRQAVHWLLEQEQLLVEGSGAIAIAPLINGQLDISGRKAAAVLTGRNLDAALLCDILVEQRGA